MKKSFYLTTTLPYVNADPHIGFAYEIIQADIIARYHELQGDEVFFNTGTDEHGMKIYRKATEEGKDPKAYVDEFAEKFRSLKEKLNLHPDLHFIRTTDEKHIVAAQEMWKRCFAKGDIYKKKYKGLYCVGDEAFVKETDLINGKCPNHPNMDLQEIEEENYFFKLENYKKEIKDYLKDSVIPDWRGVEATKIVDDLEDFSISREKSRLSWGIPVPDDDTQVMYVWFDALTSYISTLGWPSDADGLFKKFWEEGETLQLAGKDQVKFQSVIWQAMLLSAGLPQTKKIFYHGFINSGGQKMSKSLGNVIAPYELVEKYGVDATRYLLGRHINPFEDTDVTWERLDEWYNANLANGLGNLVSRVMKMAESYDIKAREEDLKLFDKVYESHILEKYDTGEVMDLIWSQISTADLLIQTEQPFKLIKTDKDKAEIVIKTLLLSLIEISAKLKPFLPETSDKIKELIKSNKTPAEPLFIRKD